MDLPEEFVWDSGNDTKSWKKHGVTAKESEEVFANIPRYVFPDRQHSQKEDRYALYGKTDAGRLLTVIFTLRKNSVRIISARDQSRKERKDYENKNKA